MNATLSRTFGGLLSGSGRNFGGHFGFGRSGLHNHRSATAGLNHRTATTTGTTTTAGRSRRGTGRFASHRSGTGRLAGRSRASGLTGRSGFTAAIRLGTAARMTRTQTSKQTTAATTATTVIRARTSNHRGLAAALSRCNTGARTVMTEQTAVVTQATAANARTDLIVAAHHSDRQNRKERCDSKQSCPIHFDALHKLATVT